MKVLFVDQFGKTTGRDTLALANLLNNYDDLTVEVYLSDTTEITANRNYNFKIIKGFHNAYSGNIVNKSINYLKAINELKEYSKENNIDVIHLQWFSIPWLEWIYVKQLKKNFSIAITVHDVVPFDNRPGEIKCLDKIYSYADILLIHTQTAKRQFNQLYKANTPIELITQGFCLKSDYQRIDRNKAKKHFNIMEDKVVFLFYGTIRPSKGFDLLVHAVKEAQAENKDIYFLAAGAFHNVDEVEYRELVCKELDTDTSKVNFGFVPAEEEQWYFSAADVLCLPYKEVTQSGVAQLGLMYELPIIGTDIGEMRDVIRNGLNGKLIPSNNISSLKQAIVSLANDKDLREEYSKYSKLLGETEFSLKNKADRIYKAYLKYCKKNEH